MQTISPDQLVQPVSEIARRAGQAILEVYARSADSIQIDQKADNSPVTEADHAANTIICERLAQLKPLFPILSEENKAIPFEERRQFEAYWLVDPLDGTKEFLKRNGEFTVNIALVQGTSPILGVLYAPVRDELYAGFGQTAYVERTPNQRERIQVADFFQSDHGLSVVCSRSHINESTRSYLDTLNNPETVSIGSSLKFMMVARGKAHLYPRLSPTSEWDTAAAQAIVEAAGGKVIQYDSGEPLRYNKKILINPSFIVYGNRKG